jgi:hypothetical protein
MYIMEPEPISTAYTMNPSQQTVCRYVYPLIVARQRLGKKNYRGNEYTRSNTGIVGRLVFYTVYVVSKEIR